MPSEQDTVQPTETAPEQVNGSQAGEQSATTSESVQESAPNPLELELEKLRKERDQHAMRANQLENERKDAEQKQLQEQGRWQEIAEKREAELRAIKEAQDERDRMSEAERLRNSVIESYEDPKTKELARKMLEKNSSLFYWNSDVESEDAARAQTKAQLDDLRSLVSPTTEEGTEDVIVDANNPLEGHTASKESEEVLLKRLQNFKF